MSGKRIVEETLCEHGEMRSHKHLICIHEEPMHDLSRMGGCGIGSCPGGSRRVLSDALVVEKEDGEWPDDVLDRGRTQPRPGVPNFKWKRSTVADILDALAASGEDTEKERNDETGPCEECVRLGELCDMCFAAEEATWD